MKFLTHGRGCIALMMGIMLPAIVISLAIGMEVTLWSVIKLNLHRMPTF